MFRYSDRPVAGFSSRDIIPEDITYLYHLLAQRKETVCISHRQMPTYYEHYMFWDRNQYDISQLYLMDELPIGVGYVSKEGEFGIFVEESHQGKGFGTLILNDLKEKAKKAGKWVSVLANINPLNEPSKKLFVKAGFKHIQETYRLDLI